jgi:hypothetical protein
MDNNESNTIVVKGEPRIHSSARVCAIRRQRKTGFEQFCPNMIFTCNYLDKGARCPEKLEQATGR